MSTTMFDRETPVLVRFPITREQHDGDRDAWPWVSGWIVSQCGPDESEVCLQHPALAVMDDGTIPPPGTSDEECNFPCCYRDASEIRLLAPGSVMRRGVRGSRRYTLLDRLRKDWQARAERGEIPQTTPSGPKVWQNEVEAETQGT